MISKDTIHKALNQAIDSHNLPLLGEKISGKVRDSYIIGDKRILISSDRLSAFDVILTSIPFKGQLLNDLANFWFKKTSHIVSNHLLARPHPLIMIARNLEIIPIEVVVRGYLAGSAWRSYSKGETVSGKTLSKNLKQYEKFPEPIITPSTKAEQGDHDMPISKEDIMNQKIVPEELWDSIEKISLKLFEFGSLELQNRGLILVDTKYEFGVFTDDSGEQTLVLADEIHTQDSSRFWIAESHESALSKGESPEVLDKEFFRSWLLDKGYSGKGEPPEIPNDLRVEVAHRYIKAYEQITGQKFSPEYREINETEILNLINQL